MNKLRKQRLLLILCLIIGTSLAVYLATMALEKNINLFYTPTQIKNGEVEHNIQIRAGGIVVKDSVKRNSSNLDISFIVTDLNDNLTIKYNGILPDLFREGQGVVVLGKLNTNGELIANQVLAKHDENYMPPEVENSLKKKDN